MTMLIDIRFGTADDTAAIADFILDAGGGIFEQLFEGVLPRVSARDLLGMAITDDASPLSYRNAVLAESEGRCCGMVMCYPAAEYGLPSVARAIVPRRRFAPVREILESRVDDSYYINTLAVDRAAQGQGLARLLLETASELADAEGFSLLSLHAWTDNDRAVRLYENLGFDTVRQIAVEPAPHLRYHGPMALMRAPLLRRAGMPPGKAARA